jgi:geranylgeranyl diphosphate synthase, type II
MSAPDVDPLLRGLSEAALWVEEGLAALDMHLTPLSSLPAHALYSLAAGGKRMRPYLVRAGCTAMGGDPVQALHAACAVEMIHTYSLIHDDLPAMDDDDLRRGRPTLHRAVGVEQAVLAGDLLLVEAFGELSRTVLGPTRLAKMAARLASAAGPEFLVGGQYMDMYHPVGADMEWAGRMIRGKTAAMIRVSLELGVLSSGSGDDVLDRVSRLGDRLGYLFQLTDDILDVSGTQEEMGKGVSKDCVLDKSNPVSLLGLDAAVEMAGRLAAEVADEFDRLRGSWGSVSALARYLPRRRS